MLSILHREEIISVLLAKLSLYDMISNVFLQFPSGHHIEDVFLTGFTASLSYKILPVNEKLSDRNCY